MLFHYCPLCRSELVEATIDGHVRLCCSNESCEYCQWNNPTPVVAALVEYQNQIVLAKTKRASTAGWSMIAGYLEAGEVPEVAIAREIKEEIALDTDALHFLGHYSNVPNNQLLIVYFAQASGELIKGEELSEITTVSLEQAVRYIESKYRITHQALETLLERYEQF